MSNSVETSALEPTDPRDRDAHDAALKHRLGNSADTGEVEKAKVNETTVVTPVASSSDEDLDDGVEYVKGHPVIKTGMGILHLRAVSGF
jgi:hypothetical protein